jgi:hypothetical protein
MCKALRHWQSDAIGGGMEANGNSKRNAMLYFFCFVILFFLSIILFEFLAFFYSVFLPGLSFYSSVFHSLLLPACLVSVFLFSLFPCFTFVFLILLCSSFRHSFFFVRIDVLENWSLDVHKFDALDDVKNETGRLIDRQTDRQTDNQTDKQVPRHAGRLGFS